MKFEYFAGEQRTEPWYQLRLGKPTASRLVDWLAVSKAKTGAGKPLKARLDYEKELIFERKFGVAFEHYVNSAMQSGIDFEDFLLRQYEKIKGVKVTPVGAWYNDHFLASPDGGVNDEGIVEGKVLLDNSFAEVLVSGVPDKHWKQIQGQLFASKRKWCDYIAGNLKTRKVKIIRVFPDPEFHEYLELALMESLATADFSDEELYDFVDVLPEGTQIPSVDSNNSDSNFGF
jgi:hypothetical protein